MSVSDFGGVTMIVSHAGILLLVGRHLVLPWKVSKRKRRVVGGSFRPFLVHLLSRSG